MTITVGSFADLVERDYGADIATQFMLRFGSRDTEALFSEAMDALDKVLLGDNKPVFPLSGPTNSRPGEGTLIFGD